LDEASGDRRPSRADERQEVRARSEFVRAEARELIDRCARLHEEHQRQRQRHDATFLAVAQLRAELRDGLRGLVTDYSRELRRFEVAPESAIILVKELLEDPARRLPADLVLELRREVVTWAIEAYYAA